MCDKKFAKVTNETKMKLNLDKVKDILRRHFDARFSRSFSFKIQILDDNMDNYYNIFSGYDLRIFNCKRLLISLQTIQQQLI